MQELAWAAEPIRIWIEGGAKENVEELVALTRRFVDAGRAG
mgnify:CR=1 FL=1